jgi:hypothetical protein
VNEATGGGVDDGRSRARGSLGPLQALDDVQRQAFEAAMRVAGELTALSGDLAGAAWLGDTFARGSRDGNGDATASDNPVVDVGRLRGDVVRAAETFSELMRAMLDVGFDAMDELARRPAPRPSASVTPGHLAQLRCTVRNDQRAPVRRVRPHVPQLASDAGTVLAATVSVRPNELDLEAHERATVEVDVAIPGDAQPARYHGLLLVAGLADMACAITVEVVDGEESSDDD